LGHLPPEHPLFSSLDTSGGGGGSADLLHLQAREPRASSSSPALSVATTGLLHLRTGFVWRVQQSSKSAAAVCNGGGKLPSKSFCPYS
jgi:hypothetical protein